MWIQNQLFRTCCWKSLVYYSSWSVKHLDNLWAINPVPTSKYRKISKWIHIWESGIAIKNIPPFFLTEEVVYGLNPNGTVSVLNSQLSKNGQYYSVEGFATLVAPGKLFVEFPGIRPRGLKEDGNYWVLSTDYKNYSVVYFCSKFQGKSDR